MEQQCIESNVSQTIGEDIYNRLIAEFEKNIVKNNRQKKTVYCFAPYAGWNNQQLVKNCGALPLVFFRHYGFRAVMVGGQVGEYPYLDTYLKGIQMDILQDTSVEAKVQYVEEHAREMDLVVLHGFFREYIPMMDKYKELNPNGKIYMETDVNSYSQDREDWNDEAFRRLLGLCDVVGVSSRRMQRLLSRKWPCVIEYLPNGFYNFAGVNMEVDFSKKENLILTVGRIGTAQKANEILLEAFAMVADSIPGWSLQLTGSITDNFKEYFKKYMMRFPELEGRVILTGIISDKQQLMDQYKKAKVFALTSIAEGTPNVAAEAMYFGCTMISSEIDAVDDIIGEGTCGRSFPIMDVNALSKILLEVCLDEDYLKKTGLNALHYGRSKLDFEKIMDRLYYLLYGNEAQYGTNH